MSAESVTERTRHSAADRRREREREIVAATRSLFDERGVRDAPIEDIANAVGINRGIIYRQFSGKEEAVRDDPRRLPRRARRVAGSQRRGPVRTGGSAALRRWRVPRLRRGPPAFVDCAMALLRRPGEELPREVSEAVIFRLGRAIVACLTVPVRVLEAGNESGDFHVDKARRHRVRAGHRRHAAGAVQDVGAGGGSRGTPGVSPLALDEVHEYVVAATVATAQNPGRAR